MNQSLQDALDAARIEAAEKAREMIKTIEGSTKELRDIAVVLMDLDTRESWHGEVEPMQDMEIKTGEECPVSGLWADQHGREIALSEGERVPPSNGGVYYLVRAAKG